MKRQLGWLCALALAGCTGAGDEGDVVGGSTSDASQDTDNDASDGDVDDGGNAVDDGSTSGGGGNAGDGSSGDTQGAADDGVDETSDGGEDDTGEPLPWPHECGEQTPDLEVPPCEGSPSEEVEPNDVPADQTPVCLGQSISGYSGEEEDWFEFEAPTAPYGGVVTVTATPEDQSGRLDVVVRAQSDHGVIVDGPFPDDGETVELWFSAMPGQRYRIMVDNHTGSAGYDLAIDWQPTFDCYEPNQTRDEAKAIPLGTIEALMVAGYVDGDDPDESAFSDWYRLQLDNGEVTVEVHDGPFDVAHRVRLVDSDGQEVDDDWTVEDGAAVGFSTDVTAGEYYVQVTAWSGNAPSRGSDDALGDNITRPYALTVTQ